jgi:hypothetical protein
MSSSSQKNASGEQTEGTNESQPQAQSHAEKPVSPPPEAALQAPIQTQPDPDSVNAQDPLPDYSNISWENIKEEMKGESPGKSSPPREQSPAQSVPEETTQRPLSPVGSVSTQLTEARSNVQSPSKVRNRSMSVSSHSENEEQLALPNILPSQQVTATQNPPQQQQQQHFSFSQQLDLEIQTQPANLTPEIAPPAVVITSTMQQPVTPEIAPPAVVTTTMQQPQPIYSTATRTTTTPIVKMQGTSDQVVKKKKGRFQLLAQETGTSNNTPTKNAAAPPGSGPVDPAAGSIPIQANANGNREIGSSNNSGVSNPMGNTTAQRTFDGTSAPMIKKKGRFVVTNVKDPEPIGVQGQGQGRAQSVPGLPSHVPVTSPMGAKQLAIPPSGNHATDQAQQSSTGIAPPVYQHATMMSAVVPPGHVMQQQQQQQQQQQPIMYVTTPQPGNAYPQMTTYTMQQHPVMAMAPPAPVTHMNHHSNDNLPSLGAPTQQPPPASMASSAAEDARTAANIKSKAQKDRKATSVPRNSEAGLGKVFYFLEQMRLEVAEADRTIKSLQTDAKFLVS